MALIASIDIIIVHKYILHFRSAWLLHGRQSFCLWLPAGMASRNQLGGNARASPASGWFIGDRVPVEQPASKRQYWGREPSGPIGFPLFLLDTLLFFVHVLRVLCLRLPNAVSWWMLMLSRFYMGHQYYSMRAQRSHRRPITHSHGCYRWAAVLKILCPTLF